LKGISRDKAKKIQNELYEIKRYIQSLSTWDLSKSKRKKILEYLNLIEADIGSIIMSEEVEVSAVPEYDLPDILNEDYFKNPQDDANNETRLGGRGKKIKKYNYYNIMTKPARRSRKAMRGGYVWRTPKTRSRSTRRRTPRSKRSRKTRFF
jgi:hypothetical protein